IGYFDKNTHAMRYAKFRAQGLFIGSGVIEAGCRTLIGKRLKQSGMFWSLRGANAIIASRCCQFSRRFEDFWESIAA
ncbi:MAG: ISKra4 family transposase, partial [Kiritimatiellia bacterium]|nr:ISKra4 family transposase [Kiritimatiellia bacterium]